MVIWILMIVALGVSQILFLSGRLPLAYAYILSLLVLLTSLGMLYRVYTKQKKGEREKLELELVILRKTLKELENELPLEPETIENLDSLKEPM